MDTSRLRQNVILTLEEASDITAVLDQIESCTRAEGGLELLFVEEFAVSWWRLAEAQKQLSQLEGGEINIDRALRKCGRSAILSASTRYWRCWPQALASSRPGIVLP